MKVFLHGAATALLVYAVGWASLTFINGWVMIPACLLVFWLCFLDMNRRFLE